MRATLDIEPEDVIGSMPGLFRPSSHGRQAKAHLLWRTLLPTLADEALRNRTTPIPRRSGDNRRRISHGSHWGDRETCLFSDSPGPVGGTLTSNARDGGRTNATRG